MTSVERRATPIADEAATSGGRAIRPQAPHTSRTAARGGAPGPGAASPLDVPAAAHGDTHLDAHEPLALPQIRDIWHAQEVIRPHIAYTPILPSRTLSAMTGASVQLKAENLQ